MIRCLVCLLCTTAVSGPAFSQSLEQQLSNQPPAALAQEARVGGDARRGAILFHQVHIGCIKCHAVDGTSNSLGPDLTKLAQQKDATDAYLVTSLLQPSAVIRKGYESVTVVTADGRTQTGLLVTQNSDGVMIRDPVASGSLVSFPAGEIEDVVRNKTSIMPTGLVRQLGNRQQFLDLTCYLLEVRDGGPEAARKLQPPPGLVTYQLPEYEARVDHAGLIRAWSDDAFDRGEAIYNRLCINCHGDRERPGSLPTSLRFAEGKFRSGADPYTMYRTLTHGFGLMVPQTWMVPQQKYDVIHYIRESYLREANPEQYIAITDSYLQQLPDGDTFGPKPVRYAPWSDMNYGPSLINTFEVGTDGSNFAYKGIAVRLDPGPGGVSRGRQWMIFDHDTLRMAAAWTRQPGSKESGFINWQGIHFDGRHGTHPRIVGNLQLANPTGPGWANPATNSFEDNQRVAGRDGRNYGPLPREWAKYRGLHAVGDQTIIEYSVGDRTVLERPGAAEFEIDDHETTDVFTRTMTIGPASTANRLLVATHPDTDVAFDVLSPYTALLRPGRTGAETTSLATFAGASFLQIANGDAFDMTGADFSITARIRTQQGGTLFSKTNADGPWVPGGKAFFVRGGRLCYDIGWVGVVRSGKRVDDGKWHDVAFTWDHKTGRGNFYIDGAASGGGELRPAKSVVSHVAKIGFAADNFPDPSHFTGDIESIAFWNQELSEKAVRELKQQTSSAPDDPLAAWDLTKPATNSESAGSGTEPQTAVVMQGSSVRSSGTIMAGVIGSDSPAAFLQDGRRLCLEIPAAANPQHIVVWTVRVDSETTTGELKQLEAQIRDRIQVDDLQRRIDRGSPPRWPETVTTVPVVGSDTGPFAVDILSTPATNPWLTRVRLTGHDFFADGDRVAVCSWDGDVWLVSGLKSLQSDEAGGELSETAGAWNSDLSAASPSTARLHWRRIASGLFQPLGLKIVADDIYVTCRDQLVILRDRNQDGETDFYECFNNDHQVTEHFHEFAMGLQRDEFGNFYYAKSARHALEAVVPHHGTLLRVASNGARTEIVANGFRAANGVCLNPDGSFIVTDQEGHWNPKNRINWVREGGFYGNMFGYHDVTDDSDGAMEQPLCWITNAFDRSPAELMWIDNDAWGPLNGSLLNLSYGYGKIYVVPHEDVRGQMQGGMCQLPIPQFPTGITRGRISPHDNGLYLSGMFAWGSSQQTQEGGFYRVRCTGKPSLMPIGLQARDSSVKITFTEPLDDSAAADTDNYSVKVWSLKRTAGYGSKHYDEHEIAVASADLSPDGRVVTLIIPDLEPTWCMEIVCRLRSKQGEDFERVIHNTIHRLQ